jgi:transposase-like protein
MSMPIAVLPSRARDDEGVVEGADPAARPRRRQFSAEYKLALLAEYDAAPEGVKGSILRREGLYSSHVTEWRKARDSGALAALKAQPRSPKRHPAQTELERERRRRERVEAELARTKAALELMGKAHALLELLAESADNTPPSTR